MASIYFQVSPMSGSGDGTISVNPSGANDTYYDLQSSISVDNGVSSRTINAIHYGIPHIWLMNGTNVYPGTGGTKSFDCSTHYDVWFDNIPYWIHITDTSGNTWGEGDIISAETADSIEFLISADENYFPTSRDTGQNYFCMKHLLRNETGIPIEYIYLIQESGTDDTYLIVTPRELRWNSYDTREREVSVQCNHEWGAYLNDGRFTMRVSGNTIFISPIGENTTSADFSDIVIVSARSVTADVTLLQTCEANDYYLRVNPSSILFDCSGFTSNSAVTISTNLPSWSASLSSGTKFSITTGVNKVYITANGSNNTINDFTDTIIVTAGELTAYVSVRQEAEVSIVINRPDDSRILYPYQRVASGTAVYGSIVSNKSGWTLERITSASSIINTGYTYQTTAYLASGNPGSAGETQLIFEGIPGGLNSLGEYNRQSQPYQVNVYAIKYKGHYLDETIDTIAISRQYLLHNSNYGTANAAFSNYSWAYYGFGDSYFGEDEEWGWQNNAYSSGGEITFYLWTSVLPTRFEIQPIGSALPVDYVTIYDASGNTIVPPLSSSSKYVSSSYYVYGDEVAFFPLEKETFYGNTIYPIRLAVPATDKKRVFVFRARYEYPNGMSGMCLTESSKTPFDEYLIMQNSLFSTPPHYSTFDYGNVTLNLPSVYWRHFINFFVSSYETTWHGGPYHLKINGTGNTSITDYRSDDGPQVFQWDSLLKYPQSARTGAIRLDVLNPHSFAKGVFLMNTQYAPPMVTMDGNELPISSTTRDLIIRMDSASTYSDTIDFVGTDPFTYNFKITSRCSDEGLNLKLIDGDGNFVDNYSESGMGATLRFNFPALSEPDGTTMSVQIDVSEAKGATWRRRIWLSRGGTRCLPVTGGTFYFLTPA